jgi:hypothetical protein
MTSRRVITLAIFLPAPLWFMAVFACLAVWLVGGVADRVIVLACLPYGVLAAAAVLLCRWEKPGGAAIRVLIPTVLLVFVHAAIITYHVRTARVIPGYTPIVSAEAITWYLLMLSGLFFAAVFVVWTAVVCVFYARESARRREFGRCPACKYDRTGLANGAVCPECGAPARLGGTGFPA